MRQLSMSTSVFSRLGCFVARLDAAVPHKMMEPWGDGMGPGFGTREREGRLERGCVVWGRSLVVTCKTRNMM